MAAVGGGLTFIIQCITLFPAEEPGSSAKLKLRADQVLWEPQIVEKLIQKHGVIPEEVEEALFEDAPHIRRVARDRYQALGRTASGRYLSIIFVVPKPEWTKPISAREMDEAERKLYRRSPKLKPKGGELHG